MAGGSRQPDQADWLRRRGEVVTPDEVEELLGPLLEALLTGGGLPWPPVEGLPDPARPPVRADAESTPADGVAFLATDNLPAALLRGISSWITPVAAAAWWEGDLRAGRRLLEVAPVRRFGPFALVRWEWTSLLPPEPHEPPAGNAYGGVLTLVRTEAGWRVLARTAFTT